MKSDEIKFLFIDYFKRNNHIELEEYSLIPFNDKSLLFTNSGMVQFKNIFLGFDKPLYSKVVTSQRCVRLGGKHNDLDSIGESFHHNTSFEMLGNFSFKDTNEIDTIKLCWNFLVNILKLDFSKLYVTVHEKDKKLYDIWNTVIGLESKKIILGTDETNFWSMDENGPCGYCTEIFYNISTEESLNLLEIWNIVFIEFNKEGFNLTKLDNVYVDTGMGLERITSVMQGHYDNFKVDSYCDLLNLTVKKFNIFLDSFNEKKIKVIVDHLKTTIFLLKEGLIPSNDGRGYILKKLIRRSILKKNELKFDGFIYLLIDGYIKILDKKGFYSEADIEFIKKIIKYEEEKFDRTLKSGITFLEQIILSGNSIDGAVMFNLYDTYGLPLDYIKEILFNYKLEIDIDGFNKEMNKQVLNSKKLITGNLDVFNFNKTIFLGYDNILVKTEIIGIIKDGIFLDFVVEGDSLIIVTSSTPFYSEKGGQVGDIGVIKNSTSKFLVFDTKEINDVYFHYGKIIFGQFRIGDIVINEIDYTHRKNCSNNHSATHLLHSVLKKKLGSHIRQAGSYVCSNYLRFDFTHFEPLSGSDIKFIQDGVNEYILSNLSVKTFIDYNVNTGKEIRTVIIGDDVSIELCGGTHVSNTGEIGLFKILKDTGIGNNLRRIEAISGLKILQLLDEDEACLNFLSKKLKSNRLSLESSTIKLIEQNKALEKEISYLYVKELNNDINNIDNILLLRGIKLITLFKDKKYINLISDIFNSFTKSILLFYYNINEKKYLNFYLSNDLNDINILDLINYLEKNTFFKGGGKGKSASGIILDDKDVLRQLCKYLETNMKSEENNVNFN
ncbi:MAG TPA: alanine--tRNA ligase [Candidatus Azoamicus sp. MARI]